MTDDDELSYEQARAELARIVAQLESGGASLEESLALWERGEELADRCQQWLTGAAARLEQALAENAPADAHGATDDTTTDDAATVDGAAGDGTVGTDGR